MNVITGVIEQISDKSYPSKFDTSKINSKRSFKINGDWIGNFISRDNKDMFDLPKEGDAVKVAFIQKGDFKNLTEIEVIAKHETEPTAGTKGGVTPVPYNREDKDWRITFQSGLKCAVPFVDMLLRHDLIPLGVKKEKKVDICFELVTEYARQFAEAAFIPREVKPEETTDASDDREGVE